MSLVSDLLLERSRLKPFKHQIEAVEFFYNLEYGGNFSEMGTGKSKITIDLAQCLYVAGKIKQVIIITDASIRDVWFDPELGELAKHLWKGTPSQVVEYHAKMRVWNHDEGAERLQWFVTNYDYIVNEERLTELKAYAKGRPTMLVLDESSAIKNKKAKRTKAAMALRKQCARIYLLNGTPIANSPFDMLSQGNILHPDILECGGIGHFRARYAVMGGYTVDTRWGKHPTQVLRFKDLDDLVQRFAPYVLRFEKKDCLDLPEKLPPVTMSVPLRPESWKLYKAMRDEMVAWLDTGVASANQVIVKILRLSQITSGFLGGIEDVMTVEDRERQGGEGEELPSWLKQLDVPLPFNAPPSGPVQPLQEIGTEKLDWFLEWFDQQIVADPDFKLLVWTRFLPELHRLVQTMRGKYKAAVKVEAMYGGQKKEDRDRAIRLLNPTTTCSGPGIVAATIGTGGKGHTFTAAHTVVNLSFDYSLEKYLQAMDRVHRVGQLHAVSYFDVAATGPSGQKTVDHQIILARRTKQDLASWTTSQWVKALLEE